VPEPADQPPQKAAAYSTVLALRAAAWAAIWYLIAQLLFDLFAVDHITTWRAPTAIAALAVLHVVRPGGDRRG